MTPEEYMAGFERCLPLIQKAIDRANGCFDINHVRADVLAQKAQFWAGDKSAVVTRIETHPSGIKSCLIWLAGGDLDELTILENRISDWAKEIQCDRVEIIGRRGWLKALPDYTETCTMMSKGL